MKMRGPQEMAFQAIGNGCCSCGFCFQALIKLFRRWEYDKLGRICEDKDTEGADTDGWGLNTCSATNGASNDEIVF